MGSEARTERKSQTSHLHSTGRRVRRCVRWRLVCGSGCRAEAAVEAARRFKHTRQRLRG